MSATGTDLAELAKHLCDLHAQGHKAITRGGQAFDLATGGWCARFVRQVYEATTGKTFPWCDNTPPSNARGMEDLMVASQIEVASPLPGDCVCFNRGTGSGLHGHTGIHVDADHFAENTSSMSRGPGTVLSRYATTLRNRVSGYYRLLPATEDEAVTVKVVSPDDKPKLYDTFALPHPPEGSEWRVCDGGDHIGDLGKLFVVPVRKET